jgi:hypothetical protein
MKLLAWIKSFVRGRETSCGPYDLRDPVNASLIRAATKLSGRHLTEAEIVAMLRTYMQTPGSCTRKARMALDSFVDPPNRINK